LFDHRFIFKASKPTFSSNKVDSMLEQKWNELDNRTKDQYRIKAIRL